MGYNVKAASPGEAQQLEVFVSALERAAMRREILPIESWQFVRDMTARFAQMPSDELMEVLDYSNLAEFYNIGLMGSADDPREFQLRLNIYPDFPGDVEFHTHRTRVSSLILSGKLENSMFTHDALQEDARGRFRMVKAIRTPAKSILDETGWAGELPSADQRSHTAGKAYAVPVDFFHSVQTARDTVTLCLFRRDPSGYRDSLILKERSAALQEGAIPRINEGTLERIRTTLRIAAKS